MANKKITELDLAASATTDSFLVVVNSGNTVSPVTNKIYFSGLSNQIVKTYTGYVGNNSAVQFIYDHNLNTPNLFVSVKKTGNTGTQVYPETVFSGNNRLVLRFSAPPTTNEYYLTIMGY